jgi:hypothetical protein
MSLISAVQQQCKTVSVVSLFQRMSLCSAQVFTTANGNGVTAAVSSSPRKKKKKRIAFQFKCTVSKQEHKHTHTLSVYLSICRSARATVTYVDKSERLCFL